MLCRFSSCVSVSDAAFQSFLNELQTPLVKKGILFLWLADVQMIHVNLNQFPNAQIWNQSMSKLTGVTSLLQVNTVLMLLSVFFLFSYLLTALAPPGS